MPFVINRIGAKRGLQLFALVLVVRVVGSAFFTHTYLLIFWRLLAAVEMPLMLVSVMKYITRMFDVRISATAYMIGFSLARQVGIVVFSWVCGIAYYVIRFCLSCVSRGAVVRLVVLLAGWLMADDRHHARADASVEPADGTPSENAARV